VTASRRLSFESRKVLQAGGQHNVQLQGCMLEEGGVLHVDMFAHNKSDFAYQLLSCRISRTASHRWIPASHLSQM
jgi:hypothetical protein